MIYSQFGYSVCSLAILAWILQLGYFGMDPIIYYFKCVLFKAESQADVENRT